MSIDKKGLSTYNHIHYAYANMHEYPAVQHTEILTDRIHCHSFISRKRAENMKRFTTDMGSLAYQNVYDLIELQKNLKYSPSASFNDMPIAVRNNHDNLIDNLIDTSDVIDDQILNWVVSTIKQNRSVDDVEYMDELLHGHLTDNNVIEEAKKIVQETPGAPNI